MKNKLRRVLFSQAVIVALLLLIQIALILSVVVLAREYMVFLDSFLILLTFLVVLYIVNSDKNPTYKLAWVMAVLFVPLFGGLFYLFIQGQTVTRMFFQRVKKIDKVFTGKIPQDELILEEIKENYPIRYNTVAYTNRNEYVAYSVFKNTDVKYFAVGEECWQDMLCELKKAEKYIFMEYFIIGMGKMWDSILEILKEKASAGVDVRIMYDGVGSLLQMPKHYSEEMKRYGIKCGAFMPFVPFLSTLQNNRDHRKIMAIDGKVAFTGGVNIADEYVNLEKPYGHWKDTAVKLTGDAAYSFAVIFLQMWQIGDRNRINPEDYRPKWQFEAQTQGYVMPYADAPNDDYQVGEFVYMDIITKATKYIHITTPYLILDSAMQSALVNAARSGVDVKIIIPSVADHWYAYYVALDFAKELIKKGVEVYEYTPGFIHAKNFSSDDEVAVVGSINLDYRSLYLHFECGAWMLGSPAVAAVEKDFQKTLKQCKKLTVEQLEKRPVYQRFISACLRFFAPLM